LLKLLYENHAELIIVTDVII